MTEISKRDLAAWCSIPATDLPGHPGLKVPLRICSDSKAMAELMAHEVIEAIEAHNRRGEVTRLILPCGPTGWHMPFVEAVNQRGLSLRDVNVFLMDECLDWQGHPLPSGHPFNFAATMLREFFSPILPELAVPEANRHFPECDNGAEFLAALTAGPIDLAMGGWGQDGHVAFNQARRNPFSPITVDELRSSTVRTQENSVDTIISLAQRTLGCAYQLVPPMSVTIGMKEIMAAKKVRIYSDSGPWKQTALRVALFGPITPEYPMSLLQEHPDALITATPETARHPISEHPDWDLGL